MATITDLETTIRTHPIIDNHAHNILKIEGLKSADLLSITSEAFDEALGDAPTTLAHLRAAKMLKKLYDLPVSASWDEVVAKRVELLEEGPDSYFRKCFQGTQTILLDDKYEDDENVEDYTWHDRFTISKCKRIERIEAVAEDILEEMLQEGALPLGAAATNENAAKTAWNTFLTSFSDSIETSIADPEVVGFKTVICYSTGLDIDTNHATFAFAFKAFQENFLPNAASDDLAIEAKALADFLVLHVCDLLTRKECVKPFQFHTGLGSKNASLRLSNPAYMQPIIEMYPGVNFVLLHSAYPYTRQAGYLASVYANCYLDLGLVWPELSRDGQEGVIREALELAPWSKLLWSTDGHYLPDVLPVESAGESSDGEGDERVR